MAKLILIKHASPQVDPAVPSHEWALSPAGRDKAELLAERLKSHAPRIVLSSEEPKAIETAQIVAAALGVPHEVAQDLHEHDRSNVPQMPTREFISSMAMFFKRPVELVLGRETAEQAQRRVTDAIHGIVTKHANQDIAVVTHGTVLALYLAPIVKEEPFLLWRRLGLPAFVVIDPAEPRVVERVDAIT